VYLVRHKKLTLSFGRVGLISDTHGLVRPQALSALKGSEIILHAGDIGRPEVLTALATIAPVIAIRGNNDREPWARNLPDVIHLTANGVPIQIIHNVNEIEGDPGGKFRIVVSGHSHKPGVWAREGLFFINPGSAGPRRFKLPVALARLSLLGKRIRTKIVELKV
jgi:putative phosphoesterase